VGQIGVGVLIVRQNQCGEVGWFCVDYFGCGARTGEDLSAKICEFEVGFACDDVVCEPGYWLGLDFETDFRAAEYEDDIRPDRFQQGGDFSGL